MRSFLSAPLAAVLAGVMAACSGGTPSSPTPPATAAATRTPDPSSSPAAGAVIRIPLSGAAPDAIVLDGETAWVLTGEGGTLLEVDLIAGREVRSIEVGFGATHLALPEPGLAAVARFDSSGSDSFLPIVDLASGDIRGVKTGALGGLAAGEGGTVWALEKADRLLEVDVTGRRVIGAVTVDVGENVHTEVQWGAGAAWVGSDGTPVLRVGDDLAIEATIEVETGLPFFVRDGLVWGAGPEQVWAIDPTSNVIASTLALNDVSEILAMDVEGNMAVLAVRHPGQRGAVLWLDLTTGSVAREEAVSLPAAVRIAPDRVWVASYLTDELLGFAR